jgi:Recombinase
MIALAKEIKGRGGQVSLREIASELEAKGYVTPSGKRYSASAVASMLVWQAYPPTGRATRNWRCGALPIGVRAGRSQNG